MGCSYQTLVYGTREAIQLLRGCAWRSRSAAELVQHILLFCFEADGFICFEADGRRMERGPTAWESKQS